MPKRPILIRSPKVSELLAGGYQKNLFAVGEATYITRRAYGGIGDSESKRRLR